jgi:hypothetical protein
MRGVDALSQRPRLRRIVPPDLMRYPYCTRSWRARQTVTSFGSALVPPRPCSSGTRWWTASSYCIRPGFGRRSRCLVPGLVLAPAATRASRGRGRRGWSLVGGVTFSRSYCLSHSKHLPTRPARISGSGASRPHIVQIRINGLMSRRRERHYFSSDAASRLLVDAGRTRITAGVLRGLGAGRPRAQR